MKKIIYGLLLILFFYLIFKVFKKESIDDLKDIALDDLHYYDYTDYLKDNHFKGPKIRFETKNSVSFQWYSILEWGDSASIYVEVNRNFIYRIFSASRINMNYQIDYLLGPSFTIYHFIPNYYKSNHGILNCLDTNSIIVSKEFRLIKSKKLLIYFVKSGYVSYIDRRDTITYIKFIEPIALSKTKKGWDGKPLRIDDAFITIYKSGRITFKLFDSPNEFWSKYDNHWDPIGLSRGEYNDH